MSAINYIFKTIWRSRYLLHDEILPTNHSDNAKLPARIGYLRAFEHTSYLNYKRLTQLYKLPSLDYPGYFNECYISLRTQPFAKQNGHLHVVKWLRKNNYS